ncbi:MAG: zinc-dependent metalloprotease, partial [Rothia sp. (in: high G+C Gram-positive bacteria)]|nr:zinc-dependent metalloprotease [Rothia sp. (in: high G+C Gram-positive bacteria)]
YLAVREAALTRLHKTNPWLREDIIELIKRYSRGIHVDIERMQEAASEFDLDPSNPEEMMAAFSGDIFTPQNTEDQKLALDRLETLLALIEGWVTLITEQATKNLPMAAQLSETMARRRATGGPAEHAFAQLVGLELRPRKMREALAFWRSYEDTHGFEARDGLWNAPETLPTSEDLDDPEGFIDRRALLNASDDELDAALEKLLAGGYDEDTEGKDEGQGDKK